MGSIVLSHILITGGAGFVGANFVFDWLSACEAPAVVNVDKLTYAGNRAALGPLDGDARYSFVQADICDVATIASVLNQYRPDAVVHMAAESHVDRSIQGASVFAQTNVVGTLTMLEAVCEYWLTLDGLKQSSFRFLHVSTDEVFGSLGPTDPKFRETTPYAPNNPYSASKAGADHMVRVFHHTHGLPTLQTNCSNNYGPYQFPEKLIPLMISNALAGKPLPVYGDGLHVRDWIYVKDHCSAIRTVLAHGRVGETYNIGAGEERSNIEIVRQICDLLDELYPKHAGSYHDQISFVADRKGHDRRYAIDTSKIERELGWKPEESFEAGFRKTIMWYLDNREWLVCGNPRVSDDGKHDVGRTK